MGKISVEKINQQSGANSLPGSEMNTNQELKAFCFFPEKSNKNDFNTTIQTEEMETKIS